MEYPACVLCGATASRDVVTQRDINLDRGAEFFTIVQCSGCELIYLKPRPTPDEIRAYYPTVYYTLESERKGKPIDRFFKRLSNKLKSGIMEEFYGYPGKQGVVRSSLARLARRLVLYPEYWHLRFVGRDILPFRGEGRILDVGCGTGKDLRSLRERGWDAYGVEFSPVAVEYAKRKYGLNVTLGDLASARYESKFFDVVFFNHSLEHMYDPLEILREAHRILKPKGLLVIHIPNAGSFEARLFRQWWVQWDVPRHLYHFTKRTMVKLLDMSGFKLLRIKDGLGSSFFLGSVDKVYKHVFHIEAKHGWILRHIIAGPGCLLAGHLGFGTEMKVYAEKPR